MQPLGVSATPTLVTTARDEEERAGRAAAILDALLAVIFSPACAACDKPLEHPSLGPVCGTCWRSILPLTPPLCEVCGDSLATWCASTVAVRCVRCRRSRPTIDCARAIGSYEGALRAIVHALKYEGRRSLANRLAALMRVRGAEILANADCVVPVPLHRSRLRARGFNQAVDLARPLGPPVCHALYRVRATTAQTGLPASRRHGNVRNAFAATGKGHVLKGAIVVLVDDVSTTGATLEACARALKSHGVREVRALTAARAVRPPR
ncbi:MAG: amidophosphoribosyltransferase [Blastocatellia bacterium]|nr:MAG: amidophosphoribosyltransferase [Blastocatellia bacterium]